MYWKCNLEQGYNPFVLLGPNEECAPGFQITDAYRCNEAGHWTVSLGIFPMRPTKVGNWYGVPLGCSSQVDYDDTIHFNTYVETDNRRFSTGEFVMICEKGL